MNGRAVEISTTQKFGKTVLTFGGIVVEPDLYEVLCTNGLLLPIRGMLWYPYGKPW